MKKKKMGKEEEEEEEERKKKKKRLGCGGKKYLLAFILEAEAAGSLWVREAHLFYIVSPGQSEVE